MEFATATVHQAGNNLYVEHGNDKNLFVEFSLIPVYQEYESGVQGRPIYKDAEHITIHMPGNRTSVITRAVKTDFPADKDRFPKQYEAFKSQQIQAVEGTPLEEWSFLSKSHVLERKAMHIFTVEQLANLPDSALTWLGSREEREKAKSWLAQAKDGSEISRLVSKNESLQADVDGLKAQISELINKSNKNKKEN